jgi:cystathionine beta-lyase
MQSMDTIESYITKNTKLIWAETLTNPMMNVVDIEAISKIAKNIRYFLT